MKLPAAAFFALAVRTPIHAPCGLATCAAIASPREC